MDLNFSELIEALGVAVFWVVVTSMFPAVVVLLNWRRPGLVTGLRRYVPVRVSIFSTIIGEVGGTPFGVRVTRKRWADSTVIFVETAAPPVEFLIEVPHDRPMQRFRTFDTQYIASPLEGEHAFYTQDRHGLQRLVEDPRFIAALRQLKQRPGFSALFVATLSRSPVRLVLDGFPALVPFRGRSGIALFRENRAPAPGGDDVYRDILALQAAASAGLTEATARRSL